MAAMWRALIVILLVACPALAQPTVLIQLRARDCAHLVTEHVPADDVAFQPGLDVRGHPVAPAELPSSARIRLPETIEIALDIPLRDLLRARQIPPGLDQAEVQLGRLVWDGRSFTYNGQPLDDPVLAAIAAVCRRIIRISK